MIGTFGAAREPAREQTWRGRAVQDAAGSIGPCAARARRIPVTGVAERPYTLLSCAVSLDGYLDDASDARLLLSCQADLDRVDALRAECDAILVGATTIRRDNPRLLVRAPDLRAARIARGLAPSPLRVTLTRSAALDPASAFFAEAESAALVYCAAAAADGARGRFEPAASVIDAGSAVDVAWVAEDLARRGVRKLLVEGGGAVFTQFLAAGLGDELRMAIAPLLVGDHRAPRFVGDAAFPWNERHRAELLDLTRVGDVAVLRYALSARCRRAG